MFTKFYVSPFIMLEKQGKVPLQHPWTWVSTGSSRLPTSHRFRSPTADYADYADYPDYNDNVDADMSSVIKALSDESNKIMDLLMLKKEPWRLSKRKNHHFLRMKKVVSKRKGKQNGAEHNKLIRIIRSREGPKRAGWTWSGLRLT